MKYPNILIISSEDINTTNSSGSFTIRSFLGNWPKENVFQIICTDDKFYDNKGSNNILYLSKTDVFMDSVLRRNPRKNSVVIHRANEITKSARKKNISLKNKIRMRIVDIYNMMPYKLTNELNDFIKKSGVQIVYTANSSPRVLFLMNSISEIYKIPAIPHFFDDWPNIAFQNTRLLHSLFAYKINKIIHKSLFCLCICELMCEEYRKRYSYNNFISLMHSVERIEPTTETKREHKQYIYAGSLYLGRHETLKCLCDIISRHAISNIEIIIYTKSDAWEELSNKFIAYKFLKYGGYLNQNELMLKVKDSDGLLFLESYDLNLLEYTRLSMSTKIPEYLSSGKPIFAGGHLCQGSIKYLYENEAAYVATNVDELESSFLKFLNNIDSQRIIENAYHLFKKRHERNNQQEVFYNLIMQAINNE